MKFILIFAIINLLLSTTKDKQLQKTFDTEDELYDFLAKHQQFEIISIEEEKQ